MVDMSYAQGNRARNFTKLFLKSLQSTPAELKFFKLIAGALALWFGLAQILSHIYPDEITSYDTISVYLGYAMRNGGTFIALCGVVQFIRLLTATGDTPLLDYIKAQKNDIKLSALRTIITSIIGLCFFTVFMVSFATIKTRIPAINPYNWDQSFMLLDRALFFGRDPWTLFTWVYESPSILRAMDVMYDVWAGLLVGVWALCFINRNHTAQTRYRFPIALMLTWFIGGTLLAILFSSVGPCYFELQTGAAGPYADQMAVLNQLHEETPLRAIAYQELLWKVYQSDSYGFGGISAMPSMHCGTSALLVLFAWKHPIWRSIALAFFMFIFIASFMLAWHYAVDGLVVLPVVLFAWWAAGKIASKLARPAHD